MAHCETRGFEPVGRSGAGAISDPAVRPGVGAAALADPEARQRLAAFVTQHAGDEPAALVLARKRWPDVDIALAADCIRSRKKLAGKAPEWCAHGVLCPLPLSAEQCSGEKTARYKAALAAQLLQERAGQSSTSAETSSSGTEASLVDGRVADLRAGTTAAGTTVHEGLAHGRLADLTGGLGVDALAFSRRVGEVIYNEANPLLAAAAEANFPQFGAPGIRVHNEEITPGNIGELLTRWQPDIVYLDPARRAADGRKVFRLADCTPDVLALSDTILSTGATLLLKLSPMADITQIAAELGPCVREVHVVEADGECKELLFVLRQPDPCGLQDSRDDSYLIKVAVCDAAGVDIAPNGLPHEGGCAVASRPAGFAVWSFRPEEERDAIPLSLKQMPRAGDLLFAPGKALLKSGAFKLISKRLNLGQAAPSTHFYFGTQDGRDDPAAFGTLWRIEACLPWSKQALRSIAAEYPGIDVTARGLSLRSEDLARQVQRLAPHSTQHTSPAHLFALRCTLPSGPKTLLIACRRFLRGA